MHYHPTLYTPRLILRKIEVEDFPSLVKYANNKTISDNIVNIPFPYREPDAAFRMSFVVQGFKNKSRYVFSIILKESGEFIGEMSLHFLDKINNHAQLAYWVGESFWNKGIATEAAAAVLKFGFEKLAIDLIYADCRQGNLASQKVLIKSGMAEQSTKGNLMLYKMTKEEYRHKTEKVEKQKR